MYLAIDLILVVLMAAVIFNAVRRGFIVSVFRLLSAVVSVGAAVLFYKDLGLVFYDHFVYDKISDYLGGLIARTAENADGTFNLQALFENIRNIADAFGLDIGKLSAEFSGVEHATEGYVEELSGRMAENIAGTVSNILAFAAIFFGALIVLNLLCLILDSVAKLPFEHKYFLKESEEQEDVCWFVQRDLWDVLEKKGMPGWLKIPEEKLLLLK